MNVICHGYHFKSLANSIVFCSLACICNKTVAITRAPSEAIDDVGSKAPLGLVFDRTNTTLFLVAPLGLVFDRTNTTLFLYYLLVRIPSAFYSNYRSMCFESV